MKEKRAAPLILCLDFVQNLEKVEEAFASSFEAMTKSCFSNLNEVGCYVQVQSYRKDDK